MKKNDYPNGNKQEEEEEEIELSLGLSLNGRFGVDPKKLKRSSSIANLVFPVVDAGAAHHPREAELWRTQSLPTETEGECRRRKELQSMRRMEARKKRMEKLKNSRVFRDKEDVFSKGFRNGNAGLDEGVNGDSNGQRVENGDVVGSSQGSIGPPRSGSSHLIQGSKPNQTVEAPTSGRQSPPQEQDSAGRAPDRDAKGGSGILPKNGMFDMPYVTTKETGPNGRKIEGFLYRYKKGEEVKIMCVCHGTFLTPKEFVAHGGGVDVEQPLKHIVVNPYPLL